MKKAYSIVERQQHVIRHLQDSLLKETNANACVDLSDDLLKAIQGMNIILGNAEHHLRRYFEQEFLLKTGKE
jgi:hypothetical protein